MSIIVSFEENFVHAIITKSGGNSYPLVGFVPSLLQLLQVIRVHEI